MSAPEVDTKLLLWAGRQKAAAAARSRLHRFGPAVVRDADDQPVEFDLLRLAWVAHLEYCWGQNLHAGIRSPRGSRAFVAVLVAWLMGRDPNARIKLVCANDANARVGFKSVKAVATTSAYGFIFPGASMAGRWADRMVFAEEGGLAQEPAAEACGLSSKPVGSTTTHLILDHATGPATSETTSQAVEKHWLANLQPGARVLWVGGSGVGDEASYSLRARPDFVWLDQHLEESGYRQEIYGAQPDYLAVTQENILSMIR